MVLALDRRPVAQDRRMLTLPVRLREAAALVHLEVLLLEALPIALAAALEPRAEAAAGPVAVALVVAGIEDSYL